MTDVREVISLPPILSKLQPTNGKMVFRIRKFIDSMAETEDYNFILPLPLRLNYTGQPTYNNL